MTPETRRFEMNLFTSSAIASSMTIGCLISVLDSEAASRVPRNSLMANNGCYSVTTRDARGPAVVKNGLNINIVHVEESGNLILYKRDGGYTVNDFRNFRQPAKILASDTFNQ